MLDKDVTEFMVRMTESAQVIANRVACGHNQQLTSFGRKPTLEIIEYRKNRRDHNQGEKCRSA